MWKERNVIHEWDDGWTIEVLRDARDLKLENILLFDDQACLAEPHWPFWVKDGGYLLYSVRDEEGWPQATLLFGRAPFVLVNRYYNAHPGYTACQAFDQEPRLLDGKAIIALQCCPKDMGGGDLRESRKVTKRVKKWYNALPKAKDKEDE